MGHRSSNTPTKFSELEVDGAADIEKVFGTATTMYVDPAGDDNNDGLSSGSPKQTINAALDDAPMHDENRAEIVINLASGTYAPSSGDVVDLRNTSLSAVKLVGSTDGGGDPDAVLDGTGLNYCVIANGTRVVLEDVRLTGAVHNINAINGTHIECKNVHADAPTDSNAWVQVNSTIDIDSDCFFDIRSSTAPRWNISVVNGYGRVEGTLRGAGDNGVIHPKQTTWVFTSSSAILDADGGTNIIQARDNCDIKCEGEFQNATNPWDIDRRCNLKFYDSTTFTAVSNAPNGRVLGASYLENETTGEAIWSPPKNSSNPTNVAPDTGNDAGSIFYDDSENKLKTLIRNSGWKTLRGQTITTGTRTIAGGGNTIIGLGIDGTVDWDVTYRVTSNSADGGRVWDEKRWNGTAGEQELRFVNDSGVDVEVAYEVYKM